MTNMSRITTFMRSKHTDIAATTLWITFGILCVGEGLCFLFDKPKITDKVHNMLKTSPFTRSLVWTISGFAAWHFLIEGEKKRRKKEIS